MLEGFSLGNDLVLVVLDRTGITDAGLAQLETLTELGWLELRAPAWVMLDWRTYVGARNSSFCTLTAPTSPTPVFCRPTSLIGTLRNFGTRWSGSKTHTCQRPCWIPPRMKIANVPWPGIFKGG
jgi:hypothetical protein